MKALTRPVEGTCGPRQKSVKLAVAVEGDLVAGLGEALDEVDLHELAFAGVVGEALLAGFDLVDEGLVALDDLGHARFDGGEIGLGEGGFAIDVVEEALVGGGAVAELGFGEELEDGGGHDVGGGVADDPEGGLVGFLEELEADVFVEGLGEVDDAGGVGGGGCAGVHGLFGGGGVGLGGALVGGGFERADAGDDDGGGEARGDAVGDVEGGGAGGDGAEAAVRKLDGDGLFAHALSISAWGRIAERMGAGETWAGTSGTDVVAQMSRVGC